MIGRESRTETEYPQEGRPMVRVVGVVLAGVLVAAGCDRAPTAPEDTGPEGAVEIRASLQTPTVSTLVVEVSAPDIPDPQVFNLQLVGEDTDGDGEDDRFSADGILTVPAGGNRSFEVRAFDDAGIRTHEGTATMHVQPGPNPAVLVVTLNPLTGKQPIEIVLGSFEVTITPDQATIRAGETQQFIAEMTDQDGDVKDLGPVNITWATSNPGVATVDGTGLATGQASGSARIVATWMGVGAEAELTVQEPIEL